MIKSSDLIPSLDEPNTWFLFRDSGKEIKIIISLNCNNKWVIRYDQFLSIEDKEKIKQILLKTNDISLLELSATRDSFMEEISKLNPNQYAMFKERAKVMLKMIKSIKTYENTPKKSFNAA